MPPLNDLLGPLELLVLLALVRLQDNAYGVTVREELERRVGRRLSLGAVYVTLNRLEEKGYIASSLGSPTAERGGRAKRLYRLLPSGRRAIQTSRSTFRRMSEGLGEAWEVP